MQQAEVKAAVVKMILVELDAYHYYRKATEAMQDEGAIFHFNLLADEELEHARSFYAICPDGDLPSLEELREEGGGSSSVADAIDLGLMARIDERQALQLAMKLEKEIESSLRRMATELKNPAARAVIEKNAESTLHHFEMIEADYLRLYGED